jgi:transposase
VSATLPSFASFAIWEMTSNGFPPLNNLPVGFDSVSGGRIISSRTPKGKNVIAIALRNAANSIGNQTEHPLAPFFKRIAYRKGRNAATTATARKLAIIIWNMVTKNQPYLQHDSQILFEKRKNAQVKNIKNRLFKLNLTDSEMISLFKKTSLPDT